MLNLKIFFLELIEDILNVTFTLFKVMIPILIAIKVVQELGGIILLSQLLAPVMQMVGLPDAMGLVWATTLLTSIYGGLIVLVNLDTTLSIAQVSILGCMMLLAHSLPIEATIAKKAGVSLWITLLFRIGGSLLLAWLLHIIYQTTGSLSQTAQILWSPKQSASSTYLDWAINQLQSLMMVFAVIAALLFTLRVLKLLGIEKLMAVMLKPFLRLLGISQEATHITIIGATLGLSFGGGLLINEAQKGHVTPRDVFTAVMLLNLLHSIIEDTLLILLIGADFYAIFWARLVFAVVVTATLSVFIRQLSPALCERYLYHSVISNKAPH